MDVVRSLDEAKNWFLRNTSGTVVCESEGLESYTIECFPDAEVYFQQEQKRQQQKDDFISGMPGGMADNDKDNWRKKHPGGRMCGSAWCRCQQ